VIIIDSSVGSRELLWAIKKHKVPCELQSLHAGDFAFEGFGPDGNVLIGVERKTVHDMLDCIRDSRFTQQRQKMVKMYGISFLILEGYIHPHEDGRLFQLYNGKTWGPSLFSNRPVMYSTIYRYLLSISLANVIITQSRDMSDTAYNVVEMYHYFQKRWEDHTSMIQTQRLNIPSLDLKPSLTRRWAEELTGIGTKMGLAAEAHFRTPIRLATADETDWLSMNGSGVRLGVKTAQQIVAEINGWRKS